MQAPLPSKDFRIHFRQTTHDMGLSRSHVHEWKHVFIYGYSTAKTPSPLDCGETDPPQEPAAASLHHPAALLRPFDDLAPLESGVAPARSIAACEVSGTSAPLSTDRNFPLRMSLMPYH
jgi:hypothetical protein